jgi:peptidoglycan-N-acetylglucosamine deacetylase
MKWTSVVFSIAVVMMSSRGYSGTVIQPYEVATWPGFRTAAISYTFDDGSANHLGVAVPMFNEFNFKLTLFTITGLPPDWTGLKAAAARGHEIASHTVTHPSMIATPLEQQMPELKNSRDDIQAHIPGPNCVTIAWPYCLEGDPGLAAEYYIAARSCQGSIEASTPADFMSVSSVICGEVGSVQKAENFNDMCESAAASKGWCIFLLHGIDDDGGYSPLPSAVLRASLQYLDTRRSTFWVATFGDAIRYIKERNGVSIAELAVDKTHIAFQMTDTLDNRIFNYPLTLRRPLPSDWPSARITQKDRVIRGQDIEFGRSGRGIMFDAVPDGGEIILTKAPLAPTGLTAVADQNMVGLNWDDSPDANVVGYRIYRSTVSDANYVSLSHPLVARSKYVDFNVPADTTYYYVVTAVDANSYESGYSSQVSVHTPKSPAEAGPVSLLLPLRRSGVVESHERVD